MPNSQVTLLPSFYWYVSKMNVYKEIFLLSFALLGVKMSQSNEWSNCSRTCGMGISRRQITFQNTNYKKEFRFCFLKECPDPNADFRSEQCQSYGKELVPFVNTSDPCKLMCSLFSQRSTEKAIAIDGTPCLSSGVCVDGTCVPVGCNGILGSEGMIDECGRCEPLSGICTRVPCKVNHNPYNTSEYVTTLPVGSTKINIAWTSSCNISENQFMINDKDITIDGPLKEEHTIKITCQEGDHAFTCGYHIPLYEATEYTSKHATTDYQWIVGDDFTICSQTCGIGVKRSRIYCQNLKNKRIVTAYYCDNLSTEHLDIHMRKCYMPPCPYEWRVSDWSPCSKSCGCGGGHRTRNVTCVQVINKIANPVSKDSTQCSGYKPRTQETCNNHHCYNDWQMGPWSDCSSSCGNGTRIRNVSCINAHGIKIEAKGCNLLTKPNEEENCTGEMCTYYKWIVSDWNNCSAGHCGQGVRTRSVYCQHVKERKPVNDSLCMYNPKPKTVIQCQDTCYRWKVEKWGKCDAKWCHYKGLKHRNYFCISYGTNGLYFDHTKCNNLTKPKGTIGCYRSEGCNPHWIALPWKECTKTCDGIRVRGLVCQLGDKIVDDTECPAIRPSIIEKCNENVPCLSCKPKPFCRSLLPYVSHKVVMDLCKINCCNLCDPQ